MQQIQPMFHFVIHIQVKYIFFVQYHSQKIWQHKILKSSLLHLILVSLVCIFLFYKDFINFDFYLLLSIAILFAISLFVLMPMINNARDQKKESKFKYLHAASVIINFLQIFILLYVLL